MDNTAKTILISLVVGAVGFGGGVLYSKQSTPTNPTFNGNGGGQNRFGAGNGMPGGNGGNFRGRNGMGGGAFGEILKTDAQSVTIKLPSGGSQIVFFSDTTKLSKSVDASKDDLQVGKTVQINGTPNADGSVAAQSIQLRAALPTPPAGGTAPGTTSTTTSPTATNTSSLGNGGTPFNARP